MTKMTIYHVIVNSDHPVPVTAQIDLKYPLAGCIHTGRGIWQVIDLETGLSFGRTADTLKECGSIVAQFYNKVQEIKRNPKNWDRWLRPRWRAVWDMIRDDNNTKLYNHLEKYLGGIPDQFDYFDTDMIKGGEIEK